jgi:hypothetical protein
MMLATWLVEFYLSKYDELDDVTALSSADSAQYDVENVMTDTQFWRKTFDIF